MNEQLEQRLDELQTEFRNGQQMLDDLQAREADVRDSLLRIAGAITVLEELRSGGEPLVEAVAEPAA
jgi:prefoldin subunit 5